MNMLIGVICEVVSAVAATERESISLRFAREKFPELNRRGGLKKKELTQVKRSSSNAAEFDC